VAVAFYPSLKVRHFFYFPFFSFSFPGFGASGPRVFGRGRDGSRAGDARSAGDLGHPPFFVGKPFFSFLFSLFTPLVLAGQAAQRRRMGTTRPESRLNRRSFPPRARAKPFFFPLPPFFLSSGGFLQVVPRVNAHEDYNKDAQVPSTDGVLISFLFSLSDLFFSLPSLSPPYPAPEEPCHPDHRSAE